MASLLSVNVGMPQNVQWQGSTVFTGVWKTSVPGPQMVRRLNIDGDGQGDTAGHGGEMRAVLVYQIESYDHWQRHFGRDDFTYGQFGENLTVDGLADADVCIGDHYRIGEAEFEVTQPRVTCYRVGLRLGEPEMPSLLVSHHRPGFYMRVLHEGTVQAGDEIVKTWAEPHRISVADTDALLYLPDKDLHQMRRLLGIPALSPGWQGSFRDLVSAADDGGSRRVAPVAVEPSWRGFRPLEVSRVVAESSTVDSIYLAASDGRPLPPALAGQFLTVRVVGAGEPPPVRSYSLSSAPGAASYRLSVKRESHGLVSPYLHAHLKPGVVLDAAAPRGSFVLQDGDEPVVLLSAGIGVTPVISMLHQLAAQHSTRDVWWVHGARNRAEHALASETHELLTSLPHGREHVFYSAADANELAETGAVGGRLTSARLAALGVPAGASAYICGPAAFMTDMQQALTSLGVDASHIHTELFGALGAINPGVVARAVTPPHPPPGTTGTGPLVTFARSDLSVPYDGRQPNLLELADLCDVPTRWSCRTGVCHTCTTPLLAGDVTYSPDPLEPPVEGDVLICCARPVTDVVLDM